MCAAIFIINNSSLKEALTRIEDFFKKAIGKIDIEMKAGLKSLTAFVVIFEEIFNGHPLSQLLDRKNVN